jgi:predicted PurR-regulated permease PerM
MHAGVTTVEERRERAVLPTVTQPARPLAVRLATIARSLVVLAVIAVLAVCYLAGDVLAPIALALLLSLLFSPLVTAMQRLLLPRALCAGLVVLLSIGAAAVAMTALSQPMRDWAAKAPIALAAAKGRLKSIQGSVQEATKATESLSTLTRPPGAVKEVVVKDSSQSLIGGILSSTPRVLEALATVVLLLFFFLSSGDNFLRRLVEVAPGMTEKRTVVTIARDIQREMSRYLSTITLINFGLGIATAIACFALGVPDAALWGAVAFLFNFAPYVGAALTGCILAIVGFSTFDTVAHALVVPGAFFLLAFIEGQVVTPTVIGRRLALNPVVVFIWLLVWGWLWGMVGVLLAGPLLACFRIVCQHTEALRPIYVLIGEGKLGADE